MLLGVARRNLRPVRERVVSAPRLRFGDDHPGIVVTENAGVLLVARRIS